MPGPNPEYRYRRPPAHSGSGLHENPKAQPYEITEVSGSTKFDALMHVVERNKALTALALAGVLLAGNRLYHDMVPENPESSSTSVTTSDERPDREKMIILPDEVEGDDSIDPGNDKNDDTPKHPDQPHYDGKTKSISVSMATVNIHGSSLTPERANKIANFVRTDFSSPDFVFIQELPSRRRAKMYQNSMEGAYDFYPQKVADDRQGLQNRMIAYDNQEYAVVERDELTHKRYAKDRWNWPQPAHIPVLVMKHRNTGQLVALINIHFSAYKPNDDERFEAALAVKEKVAKLEKEYPGIVVHVGGDFNELEILREDGPGKTYRNNEKKLAYWVLGDELRHGLDAKLGLMRRAPRQNDPSSIDAFYVSRGAHVDVDTYKLVPTTSITDHRHGVLMEETIDVPVKSKRD
jgi:endonuclease/exonuclease/phosphatase family metal-dependent hydrolase